VAYQLSGSLAAGVSMAVSCGVSWREMAGVSSASAIGG